jgi:hypothetical protein
VPDHLARWGKSNKINQFGMKPHQSVYPQANCKTVYTSSILVVAGGAHGLAGRRPIRCNTSMNLRRLIARFRFERPQPLPQPAVPETAGDREAEFELAEFGRLLTSGRPEDLKKIARVMSQPDRVR